MVILISISVSLLVIVAGMLLLAKTRKEDLGNMFAFTSYSVITIGLLIFLGSFIGGIMCCGQGRYAKGHGNYSARCGQSGGQGGCASWYNSCSKSGCGKSWYHGNKAGAECCSKGDRKRKGRKIIKSGDGEGDETVNIEIEITE